MFYGIIGRTLGARSPGRVEMKKDAASDIHEP